MATQKEIDDWNRKQRMNKDLCDWFKGLAPEKKKSFWKYDTQEAEQSRKAMEKEIADAEKNTVVSTDSPKSNNPFAFGNENLTAQMRLYREDRTTYDRLKNEAENTPMPKKLNREQFDALEKNSPQKAMDFCLNGGQIEG